jgi:predicted lipoprotein with Yx(FWY)xxD motif
MFRQLSRTLEIEMKLLLTLLVLVSTNLWACPADDMGPAITSDVVLEDGRTVLADTDGLTLYTFDIDQNGVSGCFDQCLVTWPALTTEEDSLEAPFGIHIRPDGVKQVTLDNSPLYFFIGDAAKGDINGDGLGSVWHIITK